jgi:glutamate racemase
VIENYELRITSYERATQNKKLTTVSQSSEPEKAAVEIIDSGAAIARRVEQLLTENGMQAAPGHAPEHDFMTAADENYRRRLIDKSLQK